MSRNIDVGVCGALILMLAQSGCESPPMVDQLVDGGVENHAPVDPGIGSEEWAVDILFEPLLTPRPGLRGLRVEVPALSVPLTNVDLFMSALLPRGADIDRRFAAVSFILFSDRDSDTYVQRRAAMQGFLCLFEDVADAVDLGVPTNRMAVLYAPVQHAASLQDFRSSRDPDLLLSVYDYTAANLIRSSIAESYSLNVPTVAFVAYAGRSPDEDIVVLDLTQRSPGIIYAMMLEFRNSVTESRDVASLSTTAVPEPEPFSESLRRIFASLGEMLSMEEASAANHEAAGQSPCR